MGELFADVGDLIFSMVIGYLGALEFMYVARHLYHWTFHKPNTNDNGQQSLRDLQEQMRNQLASAEARERAAGTNAMQDGVLYSDGFRIDPACLNPSSLTDERRKEIEAELERQKCIEAETRKALEEAEAKLALERRKAEEEKRKVKEEAEKERAAAAQLLRESEARQAAENERKIIEAEKQREAAERQKEIEEREAAENEQKLLEMERQRIAKERRRELEESEAAESERKFLEAERRHEAELQQLEEEQERRDAEIVEKLLEAERARKLSATESELEDEQEAIEQARLLLLNETERERKQKLIEENARLFLEAEEEMVVLQQRMLEAIDSNEQLRIPVVEEPCIKKIVPPKFTEPESRIIQPRLQSVKTQNSSDQSITSKPLLFPGVSDEGSSLEPNSSKQSSSFSTQQSEEINTGTEDVTKINTEIVERQEPDGVEEHIPDMQYTEDYLRSLDGIKSRPMTREDGSGRRRAFKKRRSSGSSTSSLESRASRDEELKMFTSLEEEELRHGDKEDFNPIKYSNEPTLKVKSHHRRHKRSPAKDLKPTETDSLRGSLEMLGEETTNPWGELVPEPYKNTEFWKREKAMSIDEEDLDQVSVIGEEILSDLSAPNLPKTSSFEDATQAQNEEAATALLSKELSEKDNTDSMKDKSSSNNKENLQTSNITEDPTNNPASSSPRLRRSPRIDEMDQYEERWRESSADKMKSSNQSSENTPSITIHKPDVAPWRDDHGIMMQGLSDFFDFQASINPSRSRSTSRNPSPSRNEPKSPIPKNVDYRAEKISNTIDVYDDTDEILERAPNRAQIMDFIDTTFNDIAYQNALTQRLVDQLELVADKPAGHKQEVTTLVHETNEHISLIQTPHDENNRMLTSTDTRLPLITIESDEQHQDQEVAVENIKLFVESLRAEQARSSRSRSRSRSRSPLPTAKNIERSLEMRRNKRIQQNDELFEKLTEKAKSPENIDTQSIDTKYIDTVENMETEEIVTTESITKLVETLRLERSRSKSRAKTPLHNTINLECIIESQYNNELRECWREQTQQIHQMDEPFLNHSNDVDSCSDKTVLPSATACEENIPHSVDFLYAEQISERLDLCSPLLTTGNIEQPLKSKSPSKIYSLPTIAIECSDIQQPMETETELETPDNTSQLVESLRIRKSRSRSKTPLPNASNLQHSVDLRRQKLVQRNDDLQELLIERAKTPEPPRLTVEYVYEFVESDDIDIEMREHRSRTPSRSTSLSPTRMLTTDEYQTFENISDNYDFHTMLNLEASTNRTLSKNTEEQESRLAAKQREIDLEALQQLTHAEEEVELRLLSPINMDSTNVDIINEATDRLQNLPMQERMHKLRCSPTTPDYNRTISEEWRDVQRIKEERLSSGFHRSTYVGESLDIGSEFEDLRRANANFRRSQSPPPEEELNDLEKARAQAAKKRQLQAEILDELATSTNPHGTKPKTYDIERALTQENCDTRELKHETQPSIYVGESVDLSIQLEDMRERTSSFRRSRSRSRSLTNSSEQIEVLKQIEAEAAKREVKDNLLDEFEASTVNYQNFSRYLNADFLTSERRASDSALIQKPELLLQLKESEPFLDLDPEEYHHYRRFSLAQEQPVEEYPNDDYVCVSQIEVRTLTGTRTWLREDYYSDEFASLKPDQISIYGDECAAEQTSISSNEIIDNDQSDSVDAIANEKIPKYVDDADEISAAENEAAEYDATEADNDEQLPYDDDSNNSEDERQTVVEIEDEFDEGISDYNERGPTDESHHETSECEEADRAFDRYANRDANDWDEVDNVDEFLDLDIESNYNEQLQEEEGAVGGVTTPYSDSDSFIEQIYKDAIKNRKQSGILRDYESILQDMQKNGSDNKDSDSGDKSTSDSERYALWAKTRALAKVDNFESSKHMLESEKRDNDAIRYLGNADVSARQSTRLRSRYGYVPQLQSSGGQQELDVDLDYKPKHEYNWRKNFKLDEDIAQEKIEQQQQKQENEELVEPVEPVDEPDENNVTYIDLRRYSLGGESITLFSRSPVRELEQVIEEQLSIEEPQIPAEIEETINEIKPAYQEELSNEERPKKKKSKKKTRKETKSEYAEKDEDDSESQLQYTRRSSSLQMESDSPKRKSRSRRSSKSSLTNEEPNNGLFSPRNSVGFAEPIFEDMDKPLKKKTKKRKKQKDEALVGSEINVEVYAGEMLAAALTQNVVTDLVPASFNTNTPISTATETFETLLITTINTTSLTPTASTTTTTTTNTAATSLVVDTFDILKDANFYPLF